MGVSENTIGLILAMASSAFIGSSFILKKKGLKRAGAAGIRAGLFLNFNWTELQRLNQKIQFLRICFCWKFCVLSCVGVGGYTYLLEPLWWAGMITSKFHLSLQGSGYIDIVMQDWRIWSVDFLIDFWCWIFGSDCWRGCEFRCLCICAGGSCDSTRCIEYYSQVSVTCVIYVVISDGREFVRGVKCLSDLCSAVLAHFLLKERLQKMGVVGCVTCIVGSVVIVIHAPQEHTLNSVQEIWSLATQPGLGLCTCSLCFLSSILVVGET